LALQLSAIAGFVDAVGYIVLLQVYVANMSDNTIALGVESAQGRWYVLCRRTAAIPLFVLGMLLSRWAKHAGCRLLFSAGDPHAGHGSSKHLPHPLPPRSKNN